MRVRKLIFILAVVVATDAASTTCSEDVIPVSIAITPYSALSHAFSALDQNAGVE